jgi:outer membrane protein assembly factor BamB
MYRSIILILILFTTTANAEINWHYSSESKISGKPVVHQNHIYFLSGNSLKVLTKDGKLAWQYSLNSQTLS